MTLRHLTASALTSTATVNLHPSDGYRWRLIYITAALTSSATAGTRELKIGIAPPVNVGGVVYPLADTQSQTAVSSTFYTSAKGITVPGQTDATWSINSLIYIDSQTQLAVVPTLISDDSYTYDILVDEEVDS